MSGYAIKQQIGDGYVDDLEAMLPLLVSEDASARAHLVPFVIMCAAALEAVLNDEIVSWAFTSFPKERYKNAADAALSMSFRWKLDMLVPLITKNEYLTKVGSIEYQNLAKLIRRRNELIHSRSYYQDLDADLEKYSDDPSQKNDAAMMDAFSKMDSKRGG